ncbi:MULTISPECIES: hypothetical protein [unclassified Streptomyces]|uniref:hypothetical protein n=1 Tax=unclassified Streptomyces TaxID=2593676 RepID=UPI002365A2A0|nr:MULTISPECIES: hypothetical protein [unclassified Streptomyces]MDF3140175.1 hypothetical protein [Streptomyces sp. T21Q-yed]WDF41715.1 hypothetical protein PBV52_35435 [Streptomyces sp. T12]
MSFSSGLSPSPAATVVRTGGRASRRMIPLGIVLTAISAFLLFGGIAITAGLGGGGPDPKGIGGIVMGLFMGFISVGSLIAAWSSRHSSVSVDHTGLWVSNGKAQNVIPWQSLAGVGLHWSKMGTGKSKVKVYSIELCPNAPIDRDDPVLWPLVRDEEPLHPTLPRLRYRLPVPVGSRKALVTAIQQQVPQLWLGETEREAGYMGVPDHKGHRERARGSSR